MRTIKSISIGLLVILAVLLSACIPAPTASNLIDFTPTPPTLVATKTPPLDIATLAPTADSSAATAVPATCTAPVTLTPGDGGKIAYKGISFILDPALASRVSVKECPVVPFSNDTVPGEAHPAYVGITFPTERQRIDFQPELRVYTAEGDLSSFLYPLNVLSDLQNAVSNQPEPITWFDGTVLHVHRSYLPFSSGKGVRGVVEYAQDYFFYTNNGLLYEFDGLTGDGHYYVNLRFPISVPFLMDIENSDPRTNRNTQAIAIPEIPSDYEGMRKIIDDYNQEALRRFDPMTDAEFSPSLQSLDALMSSLAIAAP